MNILKQNTPSVVLCLAELLIGILLLINPLGFTAGILMAAGAALIVWGLLDILRYFRMDAREASVRQPLTAGLLACAAGIFLLFGHTWILAAFPLLTVFYGVISLIAGLSKVQLCLDMLRRKNGKWFLAAINAVLSIVCAVVILRNPFTSTAVLWMFAGITLIAEAVFDAVVLIFKTRGEGTAA